MTKLTVTFRDFANAPKNHSRVRQRETEGGGGFEASFDGAV